MNFLISTIYTNSIILMGNSINKLYHIFYFKRHQNINKKIVLIQNTKTIFS